MTPIASLLILALEIPAVLFATTIHEFVRAAVSTMLGDKKPKNEGRLTLNPVKHFEPVGFILAWATGFGWGKPVETSAMFYKDRKRDTLITAVAPSVANIICAIIISFVYGMAAKKTGGSGSFLFFIFLANLKKYSICIAVYNLLPVAPMDCVKVLSCVMPANSYFKYLQYEKIIQMAFLLFLFMGYVDIIMGPIISFVMNII